MKNQNLIPIENLVDVDGPADCFVDITRNRLSKSKLDTLPLDASGLYIALQYPFASARIWRRPRNLEIALDISLGDGSNPLADVPLWAVCFIDAFVAAVKFREHNKLPPKMIISRLERETVRLTLRIPPSMPGGEILKTLDNLVDELYSAVEPSLTRAAEYAKFPRPYVAGGRLR